MAKKTIKMNEAQLRKLVKESINEISFDKNRRFATTTVTDPVGYHYTFRDAAANIVKNGFSPKYIGKNGRILGPGIYFYTEPHVYDHYGDIEIKAKITGTYPATEWDGGTMFVVPIENLDKIEIISTKEKHGYGPEHSVKNGKKGHEINQMYRQYGNRSVGGINGVDDAYDYYDLNKNSGSLAMQAMEEPDDYTSSVYRDNGRDSRWASPKGDFSTKRISESQLRNMIAESVKKVLKEDYIGKNWFDENPNNGMFSENFEKVLNDSYKAADILLDACVKEISNVQDMNAKRDLERIKENTGDYLTSLHTYVPGTRTC